MRHFSKQLMLTLVFVNLPTLLLANSIHTCPKSIAEITLLSWNLRGDGAFKPIPTGSIETYFDRKGNVSVNHGLPSAKYTYQKINDQVGKIRFTHPSGPRQGLTYTSTLNCKQGSFNAVTDDGRSNLQGNFLIMTHQ